jgi:hypothetical protein
MTKTAELLDVNRTSAYYKPKESSETELAKIRYETAAKDMIV